MRLTIIADDFTGALDTGVEFVHAGLPTTLTLLPNTQQNAAVQVLTTDSRDGDASQAKQRIQQALRQLQGHRLFKKIDSTMRGHIGLEIETILQYTGLGKAVVCPAVIEAGRSVQHGQLYVNNVLLHRSDFAHDPRWPARTSDMAALIGRPTTHLDIGIVRAGTHTLSQAISNASTPIVTLDACTHADLRSISQAISADMLPCAALGLARPWAEQFHPDTPGHAESSIRSHRQPLLIMAGSRHPTTIAQIDRLIAEQNLLMFEAVPGLDQQQQRAWVNHMCNSLSVGHSVILRAPRLTLTSPAERRALLELLGMLAMQVCQRVQPGGLLITGGETASIICQQLGSHGVHIGGSLEVGVPWGQLYGGIGAGLALITKAGGFGQPDTLIRVVQ